MPLLCYFRYWKITNNQFHPIPLYRTVINIFARTHKKFIDSFDAVE